MKIENFANNFEGVCTVTFNTNGDGICWVSDTDTETVAQIINDDYDEINNFAEFAKRNGMTAREWLDKENWGAADEGEIDDETLNRLTIAIKWGKDGQGYYNNNDFALIF
jgi:hypothetical protein